MIVLLQVVAMFTNGLKRYLQRLSNPMSLTDHEWRAARMILAAEQQARARVGGMSAAEREAYWEKIDQECQLVFDALVHSTMTVKEAVEVFATFAVKEKSVGGEEAPAVERLIGDRSYNEWGEEITPTLPMHIRQK